MGIYLKYTPKERRGNLSNATTSRRHISNETTKFMFKNQRLFSRFASLPFSWLRRTSIPTVFVGVIVWRTTAWRYKETHRSLLTTYIHISRATRHWAGIRGEFGRHWRSGCDVSGAVRERSLSSLRPHFHGVINHQDDEMQWQVATEREVDTL